jgi:hypothetical protein
MAHHPGQHGDDPDEELLAHLPVRRREPLAPEQDVENGAALACRSPGNLEKPAPFG